MAALSTLLEEPSAIAGAACLLAATFLIAALRWQLVLRAQGIAASYRAVFKVNYVSSFFGLYLPGAAGADIVRIVIGRSLSQSRVAPVAVSILADRLVGLIGLLLVGAAASCAYLFSLDPANPDYATLADLAVFLGLTATVGVAGVVLAVGLARRLHLRAIRQGWHDRGRLVGAFVQILEVGGQFREHPRQMLAALVLSTVAHGLGLAALATIAEVISLGGLSLWKFGIAGAAALAVNSLPLTPGGLGVGEAAFAHLMLLLEPAETVPPYATAFLVFRALSALMLLPAAFLVSGQLWRTR